MGDKKEQIKQKITIELENARIWNSFLLPLSALLISLIFTDQFFPHSLSKRYILAFGVCAGIFIVILMRNEHIRRIYAYIKEL